MAWWRRKASEERRPSTEPVPPTHGAGDDNIRENREQWHAAPYFRLAEPDIEYQWPQIIWPIIQHCDFAVTLELAPGHGRNTRKLAPLCRELHLVDVTESCITACRQRFGDACDGAQMFYYVNDGRSLPAALTGRATLVYSWDSAVHFELSVIESYLREIARVLRPGGHAFLHHSDLGSSPGARPGKWVQNPHWRSAVAREEVAAGARACGLAVESQTAVSWGNGEITDCVTFMHRPAA